eukprot:31450-Pelagococcus_subviridis.AAC.16
MSRVARSGRRDTPGKVLKERRSPRERGRMGTSVNQNVPVCRRRGSSRCRRAKTRTPSASESSRVS